VRRFRARIAVLPSIVIWKRPLVGSHVATSAEPWLSVVKIMLSFPLLLWRSYRRGTPYTPYDRSVEVKPEALLASCAEFRIGVGLPGPLSGRLDVLVERANGAGANTSRKEVLAAVLLAASADPEVLADLVRRYRTASVEAAIIEDADRSRFLRPQPGPAGPRPRRTSR
jgi:hypothetical protein